MCRWFFPVFALLVGGFACRLGFEPAGSPERDGAPAAQPGLDGAPCRDIQCDFARRRAVFIDTTRIQSEILDIPVLITLDPDDIDYAAIHPDGDDLRFYSDDLARELAYEIEDWRPGGTSHIWLTLPQMRPTAVDPTVVWMYYDHPGIGPGENPAEVWRNAFVSVHHLSGSMDDATGRGHQGTTSAPPTAMAGRIGQGYAFDGIDDYIELPAESDFDFANAMSVSLWCRVDTFTRTWQTLIAKGDHAWRLHRNQDVNTLEFGVTNGTGDHNNTPGELFVDDGGWHHVLISYDGVRKTMYVDGAPDLDIGYSQALGDTDHTVYIGENNEATGRFFHGGLDEVRIAGAARSRDWAQVEYLSVADDAFVEVGPEE